MTPADPHQHHDHDDAHSHGPVVPDAATVEAAATEQPHDHPHDDHPHDDHPHDDQGDHEHGEHGHDHHDHEGHDHDHGHHSLIAKLRHLLVPHAQETHDKLDEQLTSSKMGTRTLWISLGVLLFTTLLQALVLSATHSVALLAEVIHNGADALTALPLAVAFWFLRKDRTRHYTYGFGRAEDLAGLFVLATLVVSTGYALDRAVNRLIHPSAPTHLWLVGLAGLIGLVGNEVVASYRIRTGRAIGSMALVADGRHARTDGLASLAVLVGALGTGLGWKSADGVVGLVMCLFVASITVSTARSVFGRMMDRIDPASLSAVEAVLATCHDIEGYDQLRLRWVGHNLAAELEVQVDPTISLADAHAIAEELRHELLHQVGHLSEVSIHVCPGTVHHHHR